MASRASNWWCAAGALCATAPMASDALLPGDRVLCPHDAWSSGCVASDVPDPYYETNAWAHTLINLQPAWAAGYTGAGVTINIVDDGTDQTHPAFSGKYDALASCPLQSDSYGEHGTTTAAIALAADNGQCSRGVAYGATLSKCDLHSGDYLMFIFNLDRNHISSNSWGIDPCTALASSGRRKLRQRQLQGCPFVASSTSPCSAPQCAGASWTSPSSTCETVISAYCQNENNYVADGECASWTYLWMTCAYTHLHWETVRVLQRGVLEGRSGLGIVYVFSAGNKYTHGNDVNIEQYKHSRFTITVGATDKLGLHSYYSTTGSSLFISAPGGDATQHSNSWYVAATGGGCAEQGQGTSYACPVVSGVVALMLEANPLLGWRDVQGILAATTSRNDPTSPLWTTNAAGFIHNIKYGFGMVDASAAVAAALSWTNWGIERFIIASSSQHLLTVPHDGSTLSTRVIVGAQSQAWAIEWIEIFLNLDHSSRGDLQLELTSPSGTHSVLIPGPRPETSNPPVEGCSAAADTCEFDNDGACDNPEYCDCDYVDCLAANWMGENGQPSLYMPRFNWKMTSVRSWGESPVGTWTLAIRDRRLANGPNVNSSTLHSWNLLIYGHHGTATRLSNRNTSTTITDTPLALFPQGDTLTPPSPPPPSPPSVEFVLGFVLGFVLRYVVLGGGLCMISILCCCFFRSRGKGESRSSARGRAQLTEIGIDGASTGTGESRSSARGRAQFTEFTDEIGEIGGASADSTSTREPSSTEMEDFGTSLSHRHKLIMRAAAEKAAERAAAEKAAAEKAAAEKAAAERAAAEKAAAEKAAAEKAATERAAAERAVAAEKAVAEKAAAAEKAEVPQPPSTPPSAGASASHL